MKLANFYFENEYIYTHGRSYFRNVVCKAYEDLIIGWYVNSDDVSYDRFAFQMRFNEDEVVTEFFDGGDGIRDQNLADELKKLDKDFQAVSDKPDSKNFPIFDLLEYELKELELLNIPCFDPILDIELDEDDVKAFDSTYIINSKPFKRSRVGKILKKLISNAEKQAVHNELTAMV